MPKQKSLQCSIGSYQFIVGKEQPSAPSFLHCDSLLSYRGRRTEASWWMTDFMLTLWSYTWNTSHISDMKRTALLLGLLLRWVVQPVLFFHLSMNTRLEVMELCDTFDGFLVITHCLAEAMDCRSLRERIWNTSGWMHSKYYVSSCAAKLSYISLRQQNLRPGKNCFPMALFPKGMVPAKSHSQRSSDLQH